MRFLVESSTKFVLYSNDSVQTKRVCNPWKVCKSVKNFGPKKESLFFFLSFVDKRFLLWASSEYEWQKSN